MSRARPFLGLWFDMKSRATAEQLELLADYEGCDLDDLLDEGLSQRQTLFRLRQVATPGLIPEHVLERRRERERTHGLSPACRICSMNGWECEGRITRHHFIPRWLMLELENYQAYAARSICTIPICVSRHRDLHYRGENDPDKSIVPYLRDHERKFAQKLMDEIKDEHPRLFDLMASGTQDSYEGTMTRDYLEGRFASAENAYSLNEYDIAYEDAASPAGA